MTGLTQAYLDKSLKNLATKQDVEAIIIEKTKNFVTKDDLTKQTKELRAFAEDQTEALARIVATTVANPMAEGFQAIEKKLDKLADGQEEILLKLDNKANKIDLPNFRKHSHNP